MWRAFILTNFQFAFQYEFKFLKFQVQICSLKLVSVFRCWFQSLDEGLVTSYRLQLGICLQYGFILWL